jgi:2-methylcitrate dehydratase PrpD
MVHRLWEPIEAKRQVPNDYVAKYSSPYWIAVGFLHGAVDFEQFTDERAADPKLRVLADKISYVIDPKNPLSARIHRPRPHDAQGRLGARDPAAVLPRRRPRCRSRRIPEEIP